MKPTNPSLDPDAGPRPAATLVLLRDAPRGLEVLLTVRPKSLRFMGGATVFPGGAVSDEDLDQRLTKIANLSAEEASRRLSEPDHALALGYYVAALREAFEEVGFLPEATTSDFRESGPGRRGDFLQHHLSTGTTLAVEQLFPAGRWVTPHGSSVRFDTRFFLARVPSNWEASPDPAEVASSHWSTAAEAIEEFAAGRTVMAPPTAAMLQKLEHFSSVDDAIDALSKRGVQEGDSIYRIRLSPLVQLVLAPNPGVMTGPGTNTLIVGTGPTVVIDPAVDDEAYIESVLEAAGDVSTILITHCHSDHVGGVDALVNHTAAPVRAWGEEPAGGVVVTPLTDGEIIEAGGVSLRTIYAPGHASDQVNFWLPEDDSLIAGDNIMGEGTSVIAPPDGDMKAYLDTLRRLEQLNPRRIYPGHFRLLEDGTEVISGYIRHRLEREHKIVAALADGPVTLEELVTKAYEDTPVELHPVAQMSALAHLESLEKDGRVRKLSQSWERTGIE